jgi:hypothetical protein
MANKKCILVIAMRNNSAMAKWRAKSPKEALKFTRDYLKVKEVEEVILTKCKK